MPFNKITILYVINQLGIGGAERQLINLAQNIDDKKFQPIICSLSANVKLAEELNPKVILEVIPEVSDPDLTRFWKISKLITKYQPAIIHSYLFVANMWTRLVGLTNNIPVIISERNSNENKAIWMRVIDRLLAPYARCLIANSESGANLAIKRQEISTDRVYIIHNGIDLTPFNHLKNKEMARKIYGLRVDQPVIGIIGKLYPQKDHDTFFKAISILVERWPNLITLCVGDGPRKEELKSLAEKLKLRNNVIFLGNRLDIPDIMAAVDIIVSSSAWEGMPNVILEAMAASKPVVATSVGGVPEIIEDGKTGYLTPPNSPTLLATSISKLLLNPYLRQIVGRDGRQFVEKQFSIEKMVKDTEKIYYEILN